MESKTFAETSARRYRIVDAEMFFLLKTGFNSFMFFVYYDVLHTKMVYMCSTIHKNVKILEKSLKERPDR
jgi:hypothetical protein